MNNLHYNKKLQPFARKNRNASTKAEVRLWCEVLKEKKTGFQLLRQRPVDSFIADFMCKELGLIIEVDGITHNDKIDKDVERDKELENLGFTILRFTDNEIMNNIDGVDRDIRLKISELLERHPPQPLAHPDFRGFTGG